MLRAILSKSWRQHSQEGTNYTATYLPSRRCPRGVMVKAMNCGIVVREFVLQSRYYVHFRANTLGKGMNPLILTREISHSCWMYVRTGRPAFSRPYVVVHRSTYELVPASPAVTCMSGSSNLDGFRDGRYYLPTPPLGEDMTQGQFLSGV